MPDKSLSILLPVHSTRYLTETLKSIYMSQGINDAWELIVVLDRVSRQEFESANPPHKETLNTRVIESENPGIVNALNSGLSISNGKYIARIDEDDLVYPNRFIKQLKYLENHPKTVAIGGSLTLIAQNGNRIGIKAYPIYDVSIRRRIYDYSPLAHPGSMFLASAARDVGGYRSGVPEDWDLWLRLSKKGKLHNLNRIVIAYRQHPNQLSKTSLYKIASARKLICISEWKSEQELISIANDASLINASFVELCGDSRKKIKHNRVQKYEEYESLRISRPTFDRIDSVKLAMSVISKYPTFAFTDLLLKFRGSINELIMNNRIKNL